MLLNVTAVAPTGGGNLRVYPDGAGNGATTAPATSTNVLIDVVGYVTTG